MKVSFTPSDKDILKNPLEDIEVGIITNYELASKLKVFPVAECKDGAAYFILNGEVRAVITNIELENKQPWEG